MIVAPPTVLPLFSTPLGIVSIANADVLNREVGPLAAQRWAAGGASAPGSLVHRTRDDFFEWPEAAARRLADAIVQGACSVVGTVNDFTEAQWRSFALEARGWVTRIETHGCVPATNYPLTAWCAVYCMAAPVESGARADSGVLRLHESRLGTMFQDATNSAMRIPFQTAHYAWRPVPGRVAVFPAHVTHEIAILRAPGELVLITARLRFVAPGQAGVGRW